MEYLPKIHQNHDQLVGSHPDLVSQEFLQAIFHFQNYKHANLVVIFKPLSYCFEETTEFDVKTSFASRPVSRQIR